MRVRTCAHTRIRCRGRTAPPPALAPSAGRQARSLRSLPCPPCSHRSPLRGRGQRSSQGASPLSGLSPPAPIIFRLPPCQFPPLPTLNTPSLAPLARACLRAPSFPPFPLLSSVATLPQTSLLALPHVATPLVGAPLSGGVGVVGRAGLSIACWLACARYYLPHPTFPPLPLPRAAANTGSPRSLRSLGRAYGLPRSLRSPLGATASLLLGRCRHCRSSTCVRLVLSVPHCRAVICLFPRVLRPDGRWGACAPLPPLCSLRIAFGLGSSFLVVAPTPPYGLRYWCSLRSHIFCRLPP